MSTATDAYNQASLDLIYKNTPFEGIGDVSGITGSATAGSLYVALLTDTVEVAYTGYARVAVARGAGFSRTGNVMSNSADLNFVTVPTGTTPQTATKAAIYTDVSAGIKMHEVDLVDEVPIQSGVQPVVAAGALTITRS